MTDLPAPSRVLRRNDIVARRDVDFFSPYGRISRVLDAEHVEVAWGKDGIRVERIDRLGVHNRYRGYLDQGRYRIDPVTGDLTYPHPFFRRMPSLRRLKQQAISWERGSWARDRARFEVQQRERYGDEQE